MVRLYNFVKVSLSLDGFVVPVSVKCGSGNGERLGPRILLPAPGVVSRSGDRWVLSPSSFPLVGSGVRTPVSLRRGSVDVPGRLAMVLPGEDDG